MVSFMPTLMAANQPSRGQRLGYRGVNVHLSGASIRWLAKLLREHANIRGSDAAATADKAGSPVDARFPTCRLPRVVSGGRYRADNYLCF